MVHSGSTVVGAERAPSIARSTAVTTPRAAAGTQGFEKRPHFRASAG